LPPPIDAGDIVARPAKMVGEIVISVIDEGTTKIDLQEQEVTLNATLLPRQSALKHKWRGSLWIERRRVAHKRR
jgi:hypothetical protein